MPALLSLDRGHLGLAWGRALWLALTAIGVLIVTLSVGRVALAQPDPSLAPDTAHLPYLLDDRRTRTETTDAINALYNFEFDRADREFRFLRAKHPDHPMPVFLLGLVTWWRLVPNTTDEQYDRLFLEQMDETIRLAEGLWKRDPGNLEAAFFLAGAHGFQGRLHSDRKSYRRATVSGRAALKWLEVSRGREKFSPEFLFGTALFNYYREYVSETMPMLRPILTFFPRGSKSLGLEQLTTVTQTAFYTRTEAQTFLMRIYANEENAPDKAYPLSSYLSGFFPGNAYFQRTHARLSFATGRLAECERTSQHILSQYAVGAAGYEFNSLRYAHYFLGYTRLNRDRDTAAAQGHFKQCIEAARRTGQLKSAYTLASMVYLGRVAHARREPAEARQWMAQVIDMADRGDAYYKQARKYLDENPDPDRRRRFLGVF